MSTSSGFGPSVPVATIGSSAMPQIGQLPGPSRTIWGCIGQVYLVPVAGAGAAVADGGWCGGRLVEATASGDVFGLCMPRGPLLR